MPQMTAIVWLNQSLRKNDNLALYEAAKKYDFIVIAYLFDPFLEKELGYRQRWWLYHSLKDLNHTLSMDYHGKLVFKVGDVEKSLKKLITQTKAQAIYWNRSYTPKDQHYIHALKKISNNPVLDIQAFNGNLLISPVDFFNRSGNYFKVYTPFYKAAVKKIKNIQIKRIPKLKLKSVACDSFDRIISPLDKKTIDLLDTFETPGEALASKKWKNFLSTKLEKYKKLRDYPGKKQTSGLSAYLHFGQISPRQMVEDLLHKKYDGAKKAFISELIWREFAYHILYHCSNFTTQNFDSSFNKFQWITNSKLLKKWQGGLTGYPIVDAGMHELLATGFMHNRVRMIVASFLTKDLLMHWRTGAQWFFDHLLDADLANNTLGWQWVAGCGPSAAPFFRIFNPVMQSEKFDTNGDYIKKWIPALEKLEAKWIHQPWNAPDDVLKKANLELGKHYPCPIVNHDVARKKSLTLYNKI